MPKTLLILLLLGAILVPSMLGYVKKSREASERAQSYYDSYADYEEYYN